MNSKKEKYIKEITLHLIPLEIKNSLLNLIYDISYLSEKSEKIQAIEEINKIHDKILTFTSELNNQLKLKDRKNYIYEVVNTKNKICDMAYSIYSYLSFASNIYNELMLYYKLISIKNQKKIDIDNKKLLNSCCIFFENRENKFSDKFSISRIMASIPPKLSKERFKDYITRSMLIMYKNIPVEFAERSCNLLKERIIPFKSSNYGKYLNDISNSLTEIYNKPIETMTEKELDENINTIEQIDKYLSDVIEIINILYNDINYLFNISSFCIDDIYLFEDDFILKDLYFSTNDMIKSRDFETFHEKILSESENRIEELSETLAEIEENYYELIKNTSDELIESFSDETAICINTYLTLNNNFNSELCDEISGINLSDKSKNIISKEKIEETASEFFEFILVALKDAGIIRAKYLKRCIFEYIPCPFEEKEFIDYIEYSLNCLGNSDSYFLTVLDILDIIESEDTETNHTHLKNYNCSHEHHHEHNCSCNHHH